MSKRNVAFIKPDEPSFLKKLKQQIGYREGPTVETKREKLPQLEGDEDEFDDQPTVVVLKPGDLTAAEVESEKQREKAEKETTPADLTKKIVFRPTAKNNEKRNTSEKVDSRSRKNQQKPLSNSKLLSFDDEEEDS